VHRNLKSAKICLLGCACAVVLVLSAPSGLAHANGLSLLYAFTGASDGDVPYGGLIVDSSGNLYGTTLFGGTSGNGTIFKLAPDGTKTVLHAFQGGSSDGGWPYATLMSDKKGNLYGTTEIGGTGPACGSSGCGTVFKVTPGGKEKVLYSFQGGTDGRYPYSGVVADSAGNLYGVTSEGGGTSCNVGGGCGTVYKLASDGTETVLYAFQGQPDGDTPYGGLVRDSSGNLYGTTVFGGTDDRGAVFKVAANSTKTVLHTFQGGSETLLYSFTGGSDGGFPWATVIADGSGDLYGTTVGGGRGNGTVFKVASNGTESVLYAFGGTDGSWPLGGVVADKSGNLFGTTEYGGAHDQGAVFKLAPDGTETVLDSFACKRDGCWPADTLTLGQTGNLYGTAIKGPVKCFGKSYGCGAVFAIKK